MSRTKSKIAAPPPDARPAHRRGAEGVRLQARRKSPRCAPPRRFDARPHRGDTHEPSRSRRHAADRQDALPQGGQRRLRDLQQSGAPQRRLARHVGGGRRDARRLPQRQQHQGRGGHRRRRQGVRVGRRHLEVREGALQRGGGRALQRGRREELRRVPRVPEADHRHDPRLLHRRRHGARHLLRHPHRHREVRRSRCPRPSSGWATAIRA